MGNSNSNKNKKSGRRRRKERKNKKEDKKEEERKKTEEKKKKEEKNCYKDGKDGCDHYKELGEKIDIVDAYCKLLNSAFKIYKAYKKGDLTKNWAPVISLIAETTSVCALHKEGFKKSATVLGIIAAGHTIYKTCEAYNAEEETIYGLARTVIKEVCNIVADSPIPIPYLGDVCGIIAGGIDVYEAWEDLWKDIYQAWEKGDLWKDIYQAWKKDELWKGICEAWEKGNRWKGVCGIVKIGVGVAGLVTGASCAFAVFKKGAALFRSAGTLVKNVVIHGVDLVKCVVTRGVDFGQQCVGKLRRLLSSWF